MHKLLYLGVPAHGHLNPALPVLRELTQRGAQVIVYNTPEFQAPIAETGATFRAYPQSELAADRIAQLLQDGNLAQISSLLLRVSELLVPFIEEQLTRERPHAVMFDAVAIWAQAATKLAGVPNIGLIPHFILDGRRLVKASPRVIWKFLTWMPSVPGLLSTRRRLTRRYGKAAFPSGKLFPALGNLNILFTADSLQPPSPAIDESFRFVGPSIDPERQAGGNFPFNRLGDGPVVYVSLGTIHNRSLKFYRECFETFSSHPAQFILSAGTRTDLSALGPVPDNFIVRASVPQVRVLERATAFVTHGGMNSIHEALYQGVPLLLIPHQFEQLFNASVVEAQSAGLMLNGQVTRGHVSMDAVRLGLDTILSDPHYRQGAMKVQRMLRSTGGFTQAADEILSFVGAARQAGSAPEDLAVHMRSSR